MAYCTKQNILSKAASANVVGLSSDPDVAATDWPDDVVDDNIAAAEAIVDSAFCAFYAVPFSVVPRIVQDLTAEVALNKLYQRKREPIVLQPGEHEHLPFGGVYAVLDKYRSGKFQLPGVALKTAGMASLVRTRKPHGLERF